MRKLSNHLIEFIKDLGAISAGISTVNTLKDGPPSTDLSYVLPGARSALSFAIPINQDLIEPYLKKQNHGAMEKNIFQADTQSSGISMFIASYLNTKDVSSVAVSANITYRKDTPMGVMDMYPDISHRYLAVRSGIGHFGISGNVIVKEYGAAVILGSVVTTAERRGCWNGRNDACGHPPSAARHSRPR